MAKINFTNQQNQENPPVVITLASLGVLMCMVVTVLGIKLWWFKHRLSFEQPTTSTPNGAAGGNAPMVVIPRRNKRPKYKDKRWSQQISENVEVHGVFRQKTEDDMEIQRPQQLPPVRIRQLSESTQSLILPPPRNKRRQEVHSTAFEDMEVGTPITLTPAASATVLTTTNDSDTRLSLTFEEFEKQFQLKEIKPEIQEPKVETEKMEIPVPPLRLSRSSSAMVKPETNTQNTRFLKASQSITTMPEFRKVIERRPTGFSRPTEDLTKIDDFEETKIFEQFGARRPTGYIKYEEVDMDLNSEYEKELNQVEYLNSKESLYDFEVTNTGNWESGLNLEALRNERVIYQNDINESPDVVVPPKKDHFKIGEVKETLTRSINNEYREEFKDDFKDFKEDFKEPELLEIGNSRVISVEYEDNNYRKQRAADFISNESNLLINAEEEFSYKSVKERRATEFVKEQTNKISENVVANIESPGITDDFDMQFTNWPQFQDKIETPKVNVRKFENHNFETQTSVEESMRNPNDYQDIEEKFNLNQKSITGYNTNWQKREQNESSDLSEMENLEINDKEIKSPKQKIYNQLRSLMTEESTGTIKNSDINENGRNDYSPTKQRRPTGFERNYRENEEEFEEEFDKDFDTNFKEEFDKDFVNIELNERRPTGFNKNYQKDFEEEERHEDSSIKQRRPTGFESKYRENEDEFERSVTFNVTKDQDFEKDFKNVELNQRRPTGFNRNYNIDLEEEERHEDSYIKQRKPTEFESKYRENEDEFERSVTFNITKDQDFENDFKNFDLNQRKPTGLNRNYITDKEEEQSPEHKVKFENTNWPEDDYENYSLNQRRPTGFVRNNEETIKSDEDQEFVINDLYETKVKFSENTKDSKEDSEIWLGKQRRPTGYTRNIEMDEIFQDNSETKVTFNETTIFKEKENDLENSIIKQRRPTGYVKKAETTERIEADEIGSSVTDFKESEEFSAKPKRPTSFTLDLHKDEILKTSTVRFQEIPQSGKDFDQDSPLKQRRPTGFVRTPDIEELFNPTKEVNFNLPQEHEENRQENEILRTRRPTGHVRHVDYESLENLENFDSTIPWQNNKTSEDLVDPLWQELEKGLDQDFGQNIEEEFNKIRHSYEANEGDFLELKMELSPIANNKLKPLGFGKTIDDDWENFEKLKSPKTFKLTTEEETEIHITYNEEELNTTSILKESKLNKEEQEQQQRNQLAIIEDEEIKAKPRKSKVTFDFKTEERLIPARNSQLDSEEDEYYEHYSDSEEDYDNPPPAIPPPQPRQRLSNVKYNSESSTPSSLFTPVVSIPTSISLFGSQISQEDDAEEDSWSAIRKHRNLTEEFNHISMDASPLPLPATSPPKPAYRNPLAQLAIQRAKEVKSEMGDFKARSVGKPPEASKRHQQKMISLNKDDFYDTEA